MKRTGTRRHLPTMVDIDCALHRELKERLEQARSLYATAVGSLKYEGSSLQARENARAAREIYRAARRELKAHLEEHGCGAQALIAGMSS